MGEKLAKVLIKRRIPDYDKWKVAFEGFAVDREVNGSKGGLVLRDADDPRLIYILLEWDDLDKARKFYEPQSHKKRFEKGGAAIEPEIYFIEEVEETSY
jgi:heme-degrading monooxygenase HmoA